MNPKMKNNPRNLALTTLDQVTQRGSYSNLQLNQVLSSHQLKSVDAKLVTNLVYGVLQHKLTLEYWLAPFIHRQTANWVKMLLLMSLYQYRYLDRIPVWAVTNEAIEIAKARGNVGSRKFVTGVLHAFLRQGPRDFSQIKDPLHRLSIQSSVPQWLVNELINQYGWHTAEKVLMSINEPAHLSIRVNTARGSVEDVQAQLAKDNIQTHRSQVSADGLIVEKGQLFQSAAFQRGLVTAQDESAMLAVESMHLSTGDRVLDACAAPGGKTSQIAAQLDPKKGRVDALDIHAHKVQLIKQNMQRLGVADRVVAHQLDARRVDDLFLDEEFDKILVDAPCSGIGLLRRKPEIRYDKSSADSKALHQIQLSILNAVAPKLKKGGIITYSTCTILPEENELTVRAFLKQHPKFRLLKTQTARAIKDDRSQNTLTILPSDFGSDGFFIGTLQRFE